MFYLHNNKITDNFHIFENSKCVTISIFEVSTEIANTKRMACIHHKWG